MFMPHANSATRIARYTLSTGMNSSSSMGCPDLRLGLLPGIGQRHRLRQRATVRPGPQAEQDPDPDLAGWVGPGVVVEEPDDRDRRQPRRHGGQLGGPARPLAD